MSGSEIIRFILTWLIVYACLAYTYGVGKIVPIGKVRLVLILPVVALFLLLPLCLTSFTLCTLTALFISWLGSFKLVLFSFGKGPLATNYPSITFSRFLALGSLPIILSRKSLGEKVVEIDDPSMISWVFALKITLLVLAHKMFRFEAQLHPVVIFSLYGVQFCLTLEFISFGIRAIIGPILGLELDIPFDEPIISTSLQNFWGRRWNIVVSRILRDSIYDPVRTVLTPYIGSKHAQQLSVVATFGTSGIMHDITLFYFSRKQPTWDMTCYFLLQGVMVVVETDVKDLVGKKWQLPRLVSILLTLNFNAAVSMPVIFPKFSNSCASEAETYAPLVKISKALEVV